MQIGRQLFDIQRMSGPLLQNSRVLHRCLHQLSPLFPTPARSPPRPSHTTKIRGGMGCRRRIPSARRDPEPAGRPQDPTVQATCGLR
jgi:hypothetical protein